MVLVFVIAQQASVGTSLAGAGTVLISLSFVFAITAQEILGSCIFLFVKRMEAHIALIVDFYVNPFPRSLRCRRSVCGRVLI
jgi:hypothetical protein